MDKPLGKNYYCDCGEMFVDFERNGTNYCGNCGQKLRGVSKDEPLKVRAAAMADGRLFGYCKCGETVVGDYDHCCYCGQALDWGVE